MGVRARLVRQLLTECSLIAASAGSLGFMRVAWLTGSASAVQLPFQVPLRFIFSPDVRDLAFSCALTVFTVLSLGLAPAIRATGSCLTHGVKDSSNVVVRDFHCPSLRKLLVVSQVAGSIVLLLITSFLVIGHRKLVQSSPGFDSYNAYLVSVNPICDGLNGAQSAACLPYTDLPLTLVCARAGITFHENCFLTVDTMQLSHQKLF